MKAADFKLGDYVQLHPASNHFMRGIRYGTVRRIASGYFGSYLVLEPLGRPAMRINVSPADIIEIVS